MPQLVAPEVYYVCVNCFPSLADFLNGRWALFPKLEELPPPFALLAL